MRLLWKMNSMKNKSDVKAIFYSVSEISSVLVEIHSEGKQFFISLDKKPTAFANLQIAKQAAIKHGAKIGFLALDKTYEEVDFLNDYDRHALIHEYDFVPISLV
jgi:hypothetical protein